MTLNFAHRGFSGLYPENTMLAFEKAVEAGCDGIELDVQLTKDRELIILHDEEVDRTTDGHGFVKDMTLDEIRSLDASYRFRGQYGINRIPTLREYLTLAKSAGILTNIELKTGVFLYEGIEEQVLSLIDEFSLRDRIIISSFNHASVKHMQSLAPDMTYGFLEESRLLHPLEYTAENGVQGFHPEYHMVDAAFMEKARSLDLLVNVWTVNLEEEMRELALLGVNILIGNHPDLCRKVLASLPGA